MKKKILFIKGHTFWKYIILGLIFASGYLLYWTNMMRVQAGFFENGIWIFWNNLAYVMFFGLVTGFVISNLLNKTKK